MTKLVIAIGLLVLKLPGQVAALWYAGRRTMLDGNVLVPVIFSEAVNLHPVAIISAVLVFGGIWGLAGVFFAIPLATLIKAIINSWPGRVQTLNSERINREPVAEADDA